ncbi:UNVERIFIED_CONTAM: hypothetical protein FKN15_015083 [Acipenser sinensis]
MTDGKVGPLVYKKRGRSKHPEPKRKQPVPAPLPRMERNESWLREPQWIPVQYYTAERDDK